MDFQLTGEQSLLRDSVRRFVSTEYTFERRAGRIRHPDRSQWRTFGELGWLAAPLGETVGGLGEGPAATAVIMEEFGRALVVEPYLGSVILAGSAVEASGDARGTELLSGLLAGDEILALAHGEERARGHPGHVAVRAEPSAAGFRLHGRKIVVLGGGQADRYVVSARTGGATRDPQGISLFLLGRDHPGLAARAYRTVDGFDAADLLLEGCEVGPDAVLGQVDGAGPALASAVAHGILAVSAEAIGCMDAAIGLTRDYLRTRKQFGTTLGSFQALQHRMAEMYVELEQSRSMLFHALSRFAGPGRDRALSALKVQVGESGAFVGAQGIQLHGGVGVTEDFAVGHYYKRLLGIGELFGNADHHLARFSETLQAAGS